MRPIRDERLRRFAVKPQKILSTQRKISMIFQQHFAHGRLQRVVPPRDGCQCQSCAKGAHAAIDIRSNGPWNHHRRIRGHNGAYRRMRSRMKIGRGAGARGRMHACEIQQLLYGFVFQHKIMRQQNVGFRVGILNMPPVRAWLCDDAQTSKMMNKARKIRRSHDTAKNK